MNDKRLRELNDKKTEMIAELIVNSTEWRMAAQTLTYLLSNLYDASAQDTLRLGRKRLAMLYEMLSHDVTCWREIAECEDASDYIRAFAKGRAEALDKLCEEAHKRFMTVTEGQ